MGRYRQGFTLLELSLTLLVMGMVTALAVPALFSQSDQQRLELAAGQIAGALRFARDEALRIGLPQAVVTEIPGSGRISVHALDSSGAYPLPGALGYDPFTKQPYDFNPTTAPMTSGVTVTNSAAPFDYAGLGVQTGVYFNANGTPFFVPASGVPYLLTSAAIVLVAGGQQRTVSLDRISGRVRIQ